MQDDLLKALLNKVDGVLTGGDEHVRPSSDNYVAWCSPGVPFQPKDLLFAVKGISGGSPEETRELVRNAAQFSRWANTVPSSNVIGGTFEGNGTMVWDIYDKVLRMSRVPETKLTPEEQAKIKKFQNALTVTKQVTDYDDDGNEIKKEVPEDSPMMKAYKKKMAAYNNAVIAYNNKRLAALNAESNMAVQDFTMNADTYRSNVVSAMDDWVSEGKKLTVEKMLAFLQQTGQRDLSLIKRDLQDKLARGKMTDPAFNAEFYMTTLYPGSFINTDEGWTQFTFSSSSANTYAKETHASTSASGGLNWGLWRASASGGHTKDTNLGTMDASDFEMEFKVTQAPLGRAWFSPEFLINNAWTWDETLNKPLSDGQNPPKGQMIAYPTTAVFIKDVKIKSSRMSSLAETISSSLKAEASVGWGPFRFGSSHSQSSSETRTHFDKASNTLTVEGMQLIAFKCFALPKTPDCKIKM